MSPKTKILLIVSFCLNAVLAAGYFINRSAPQPVAKNEPTEIPDVTSAKKTRPDRALQAVTVNRETALDWASVESADYRAYIENLRAIGCPEETVRDIIIADVNKLYASKVAALYPSPGDFKFWQVEDRVARNEERERDNQRRELDEEKRELIEELLGVDYEAEIGRWSGRPDEDAYRYGFLSEEKQEQVKTLSDKFRLMERELFRDSGGWTPENRAKFTALRAQREAELAAVLGPEEFEQYQLRNSYTARNMRENLTGFQPNEDEFRRIFEAKKAYDDQFGFTRDGGDETVRAEREIAKQKLDEQLKATLGEERFHEYQLSQDERFRDAFDFAQRYELPRETADTVYQVRVAAEQERQRIQNDRNLSEEARSVALKNLGEATSGTLGSFLGADNFKRFQDRNEWLGRLARTGDPRRGERDRGDRRRD